ncbi:alpha/beta fold hydrolase [Mycobacterium simiae]|uniref:alpha/beta fold hydrolase n=1 Tax=Mycobacterium simiae TaxID=1784 RepID=UPI00041BE413|nr:alpha/beta hydrolase [Mycobacterium simiae]BBX43414.1 hydrolase [Mycobacterium simiae]
MLAKEGLTPDKPPLVLLHGLGMTAESAWQEVVPLVSPYYRVFTPNALGHPGGPPAWRRPVTIGDVVDAAQEYFDQNGLDRPHLAGNSLGGYVAIELARRGRAATVCALSPAGFWTAGDGQQPQLMKKFKTARTMARLTRTINPLMFRSARLRRLTMRDTARHGHRLTPARALNMCTDFLASPAIIDIIDGSWEIAPLDPLPCPITIGWSESDATLPMDSYVDQARKRLPRAVFEILPGVGHVPMFDDPQLVARMILTATGADSNRK